MKIISHRGYWKNPKEKNQKTAFERSFSLGFGTETDLRDFDGHIVISHDIADGNAISLNELFSIFNRYDKGLPLALNIKADGLQQQLKAALQQFAIENYFVFDMSVPDTIGYIDAGIDFFSRQSEYEPQPAFYNECKGVWLDSFKSIWYKNDLILSHIKNDKQVAIVSPELHKRNHLSLWQQLKADGLYQSDKLILCTDIPEQAVDFF
jgi:glycerophosphoryl diester phosphodiesterase